MPVAGDWNGDGSDSVGIFRPDADGSGTGAFLLSNSLTQSFDEIFFYAKAGDMPVAGDWNGDGFDAVGIFRPLISTTATAAVT